MGRTQRKAQAGELAESSVVRARSTGGHVGLEGRNTVPGGGVCVSAQEGLGSTGTEWGGVGGREREPCKVLHSGGSGKGMVLGDVGQRTVESGRARLGSNQTLGTEGMWRKG